LQKWRNADFWAYWDPEALICLNWRILRLLIFSFSVIADVSCDVGGGIPTTVYSSTIADPVTPANWQKNYPYLAVKQVFRWWLSIICHANFRVESSKDLDCSWYVGNSSAFGRKSGNAWEGKPLLVMVDLTIEFIYLQIS
jgi:hypothetical protein